MDNIQNFDSHIFILKDELMHGTRDISVCIATWLNIGPSRSPYPIPDKGKKFLSSANA
jgi:hypothetical protein